MAAGWVLLMQRMMRTIEVIRRARQERGEALQAGGWPPGSLPQRHRELEILRRISDNAPIPGAISPCCLCH
jgi:hypothetical protein